MAIIKKRYRIKVRPDAGPALPPEPYEGAADDEMKVDTGSPISMIKQSIAKRLCVPRDVLVEAQIKGVGGSIVVGFKVPVEIQIDKRRAVVHAFIPYTRLKDPTAPATPRRNLEPYDADENILGLDFIKKSGARIHGGARPGSEFRGVTSSDLRYLEPITDPALRALVRAGASKVFCIVPDKRQRTRKRKKT